MGVGFITEDEAQIDMTLHRYPGQQVGILLREGEWLRAEEEHLHVDTPACA